MQTFALQSGSSGNCYFYQSKDIKLLFDAGIPWRAAAERLAKYGISQSGIRGIFISHDHSDHVSSAGVYQRKLKAPLFTTRHTHAAVGHRLGKVRSADVQFFEPGEEVKIGHVSILSIPTPHDASDPCAFVVDDGATRVGILTDLGHGFPGLRKCLENLDAVFMESNYDEQMLKSNVAYPAQLKWRIRSPHGHLENSESAELLNECCSDRLQVVLLAHLSAENNSPAVALGTHQRLTRHKKNAAFYVAPRHDVSSLITLDGKRFEQACLF
ncbi:MAG: MBL fold metallo-hydrolase [Candidatus Sumerlaeaceae bacterium]